MIRKKYILFVLIAFIFSIGTYSQTAKEVLSSLKEVYETSTQLQANLQYRLYKGYEAKEINESYEGVYLKKNNHFYAKIGEVEIISTPSFYIKLNHREKALLLADPVKITTEQMTNNIEQLFDYLDIVKFNDKGKYWEIELKAKPITQLPFSSVEIQIEKNTYFIKKQVFYYYGEIDFSKERTKSDMSAAKLEVVYSNYKQTKFSFTDEIFNEKKYVSNTGKKYNPILQYKEYEIVNAKRK